MMPRMLLLILIWVVMPLKSHSLLGPDSMTEVSGRAYANMYKLLNDYRDEIIENTIQDMLDDEKITVDEYRVVMSMFKDSHAPLTLLPITTSKIPYNQDVERDKLISLVLS